MTKQAGYSQSNEHEKRMRLKLNMIETLQTMYSETGLWGVILNLAGLAFGLFLMGAAFKELVIDQIAMLIWRHKCYHGVWNGNVVKNGKMKCSQCQAIHDEIKRKEQLRIEYQNLFTLKPYLSGGKKAQTTPVKILH